MPIDDIIDLDPAFNRPKIEELENLDIGISIQSRDLTVVYENKRMRELTGGFNFRKCFERWEHLPNYDGKPCKECTISVSVVDGKNYNILTEKTTPDGQKLLLEVNHVPLFNKDGEMEVLIETYKDVTYDQNYNKPVSSEKTEYNLGFVKFGNMGGEYVIGDNQIKLELGEVETFYTRMGIFWFTAIGQGHQWISNLFGPLPVLDFLNYVSMAYSFKLKDDELRDKRTDGEDLVLLIFIVQRDQVAKFEKRNEIVTQVQKIINQLNNINDLSVKTLRSIRFELDDLMDL